LILLISRHAEQLKRDPGKRLRAPTPSTFGVVLTTASFGGVVFFGEDFFSLFFFGFLPGFFFSFGGGEFDAT
jgi:hypothetical protein